MIAEPIMDLSFASQIRAIQRNEQIKKMAMYMGREINVLIQTNANKYTHQQSSTCMQSGLVDDW